MTERHPGQWPIDNPSRLPEDDGQRYVQRQQERALHEMVLASIRHDLEQQPSPLTVITAARDWCMRITSVAEDVAQAKRRAA
ncbi:hypothetical protein [Streptomyces sp. DH24]|uniref:hypothetical protein n=1 Tax=Streptomyces sp. DH24 TaxID=3040123 RepID=UPI0024431445|nr:hypothetical protein [Streptomyces sp. DH24]MDG9717435.1 hypothetical protein [Streptomyces sp. DH24]